MLSAEVSNEKTVCTLLHLTVGMAGNWNFMVCVVNEPPTRLIILDNLFDAHKHQDHTFKSSRALLGCFFPKKTKERQTSSKERQRRLSIRIHTTFSDGCIWHIKRKIQHIWPIATTTGDGGNGDDRLTRLVLFDKLHLHCSYICTQFLAQRKAMPSVAYVLYLPGFITNENESISMFPNNMV